MAHLYHKLAIISCSLKKKANKANALKRIETPQLGINVEEKSKEILAGDQYYYDFSVILSSFRQVRQAILSEILHNKQK